MNKNINKVIKAIKQPTDAVKRIQYNLNRFLCDCSCHFGYYNYPNRIIFIAGMALSGSTWAKNLLARVPGYYTRHAPMPYSVDYNQNICDAAFSKIPRIGNTLFKTHLKPTKQNLECIQRNDVSKILVTYRDLRDVFISRYHRLMVHPKPRNAPDFVDYRAMSKEDALTQSLYHIADEYVDWINGWFKIAEQNPGIIHFTKFEDLKKNTHNEFKKILQFYDIDLSDQSITKIIEDSKPKSDFKKNFRQAAVLPNGIDSNFRIGKSGYWKNELSDKQLNLCKELLGPELIKLNYESDLDW